MEKNYFSKLSHILQSKLGFWPLLFLFLVFGILFGEYVHVPSYFYLCVLIACVFFWLYALKIPTIFYWLLIVFASSLLPQHLKINDNMLEDYLSVDLCFYVEEVKGSVEEGFKAQILSEEGRFYLYSNLPLYPGELMQVRTQLKPVSPAKNPGEFCFFSYLKSQNLRGTGQLNFEWQIIERKQTLKSIIFKVLYNLRDLGKLRFENLTTGSLYSALVFGTGLDEELAETSRTAGTSHFLVVSGLHVGYLAIIIQKLAVFGSGSIMTVVFLFFYAFLVGGTPSVWRAVLSYLIAQKSKSRMLDRLALTLTLMLVLKPSWLFSLSFQYSALAVFGIALLENWEIWGPLKVGLGASLMVLPLSLVKNRKMNLLSLPVNILLGPVIGVMMLLALVYLVVPVGLLGSVLDFLGLAFVWINEVMTSFTFAVSGFNNCEAIFFWVLLFFIWHEGRILPQKRLLLRRVVVVFLVICVTISVNFLLEALRPVELYFLQILDGDAALVRLPYGRGVLIDTGSRTDTFDGAERILNPALLFLGIKRIETVYLTHSHLDHIGGLENLVFCDKIMIGNELLNQKEKLRQKAPVLLAKDEAFSYGTKFEVLDLGQEGGDPNNNSLIQVVEILGWKILFTADREMEGLEVLNELALPVDIVKVPHHGSPGSLHREWMETTTASVAVFTGGKYGRPDPMVVEAWQDLSARALVTKTDGAVRIRFYLDRMQVDQWQNGAFAEQFTINRDLKRQNLGGINLWQKLKTTYFSCLEKMNIYLRKIQKSF
ncbi:MAG: ComEC/Rec2 family competence protein [Firmicutes bacterium]|nr:ComEC/Rec2 family competence protein [Bacillota bacterium]